jgi:hypothetical protein
MVNSKKMVVAAAVLLIACSAMASNFRAADQVYVPIAGHAAGSSGTFISDIFIANLNDDAATISVIFASGSGGTQQSFANLFTLQPRERRELVDFIAAAQPNGLGLTGNQLGQLIFNGCQQGKDCGPATQDSSGVSPFFRNISVESRIYSIPPGTALTNVPSPPTTGQDFAGLPWYNFVSADQAANGLDTVFITGLRNTGGTGTAGTYRGNVGLVNASQFSTTDIVVRLFNGATGAQIGSDFVQTLQPLGQIQANLGQMFPSFTGPTATNAFVTVSQRNSVPVSGAPASCLPNGCQAFFAFGSVLDNITGDATTLEPQYGKALPDAAIAAIYPSSSGKSNIRRAVRH